MYALYTMVLRAVPSPLDGPTLAAVIAMGLFSRRKKQITNKSLFLEAPLKI